MINLILSFDYEIFGNGSGDVRRDMIEPAQRLMELCNKYDAKLTFFWEIGEYQAMKKAEEAGLLNLDYSPSLEIEKQIQYAAGNGHDVQLHLHPWWIGAVLRDNTWQLSPEYLRITDLPNGIGSENDSLSISGVLFEGKHILESLIKPVCPNYECLVYRAAVFWGQPSGDLIKGLKKAGLIADSSVVSGLYETSPVLTDYREAKSALSYWWTRENDICQDGPIGQNIIEFPVYSRFRPYICNFKLTKLFTTIKRRNMELYDIHHHGMKKIRQSTESLKNVIKKMLTSQPIKYDFCKLSARDMIRGLKKVIRVDQQKEDELGTPLVMLGHSKDFWNDRNLEMVFRFVERECEDKIQFSTLGNFTKEILKRDTKLKTRFIQKIQA